MNSDFKFYLALARKRLPVMLLLLIISMGIGVSLALTLPPRYAAGARLLVENAQIPDEMVVSTVQTSADQQLQIIEERLMTRANMLDVANKFDIFAAEGDLDPNEVFEAMEKRTEIQVVSGNRNLKTVMTIAFEADDPATAANVVNEFVTLVENESAEIRIDDARETAEFFQTEVQRLSEELTRRSAEILKFKSTNKDALPEEQTYRLERQAQLQERLNLAARDRVSLSEQINRLRALGQASGVQAPALSPAQQRLAALNDDLSTALSVYSETHPRVKTLRAQISALEATIAPVDGDGVSVDPVQGQVNLQIAELETRIEFLDADIAEAEEELEKLRIAIERTPEITIQLESLELDYERTQNDYNRAIASLSQAQISESVELQGKGERISVIERAIPPTTPSSPNRKLVAGGGVFVGTALAALFFTLTELLNKSIRRPIDLTRGLGVQPLATIPFIERESVKQRRRALYTILIAGVALAVPITLWAIHTYYLPLDLIYDKVLDALGL